MLDDIGGRTGKPVLNGKVPRQDSDGCEVFTDYFTATEDSSTLSPNEGQDGAEEQPLECGSPSFLDESLVLDSLEGSWTQGDSRAGSPVIHPEDVSAGGNSSHLYVIEAMRRHELSEDSDLHLPAHKEGNSSAENITCTKTDIQAIIVAVPDSSTNDELGPPCSSNVRATGRSEIASEVLEKRESSADSDAAKREAQLERDNPFAFSLAGLRTGEEKPNPLSPSSARSQINANFWRHPLFRIDDDISQLFHTSDTSEGDKWPKRTLPNVSKVAVLGGPQVLWPRCCAGTSLAMPDGTDGEMCEKKIEEQEGGTFESSVPEGEKHKRLLQQKRLPLLLPVPKAEPKLNDRETDNSGGIPLISRDLWSSGAWSEKGTQGPLARFAQWANTLDNDCDPKSTSERCSGSSQRGLTSSENASEAAASESPNSKGAHPVKANSWQEAPKTPKESQGHSPRRGQQVPGIGPCLHISPTTRKSSALPNLPTELNQQPLQNLEAFVKSTSFWSRPKPGASGPQLSGGSQAASAKTELNQQPLQNQREPGEKPSFWSRPKSSALDYQVSAGLHTASAPTELNQHPLRNQKVFGEKPSFWSRPKTSALGSQVLEGSHTANSPTELNQGPLQAQKVSGEKRSFWSRPKPSASVLQASEECHKGPQKIGVEPATTTLSCHYNSGKNGRDTSGSTVPNVPVDISNGNTADLAGIPAKRVWKRRPLLLPNFMKRPASCLEDPRSCALKPLNTDQTRLNKSTRKADAQDEAKDTTTKMRKCDAQCKTTNASAQTRGCQAEVLDTSAQTSFICVLGKHVKLCDNGQTQLRATFHVKLEDVQFKDLSLRHANEDTPFSFATYMSTNSMAIGKMRLASNQEKPTATNVHFDMVLVPQDGNVKVTTIGQSWLLLNKGCSFFIRRGVPFTLKNVGTATAEILYILSLPC